VLVLDAAGAAGLERLAFHGLEVREVALEDRTGRRAGLGLLQPLGQLRSARGDLLGFHGASSMSA